jgi:hypothetical protein
MGDSMFLQFYGGVDLGGRRIIKKAGDVNGRVGLGWKF